MLRNRDNNIFDIGILDDNDNVLALIEFQGDQHFHPVPRWGGLHGHLSTAKQTPTSYHRRLNFTNKINPCLNNAFKLYSTRLFTFDCILLNIISIIKLGLTLKLIKKLRILKSVNMR